MKIQGTKIRGLKLYSSAATVEPDSYFNLVSLLLPGNGTNGAQNNTFLDSSTNNFTVTRNGNTTQGTFSPFSQTGWSNYFNGSSQLVITSTSAAFDISGDFTVECWILGNDIDGQVLAIEQNTSPEYAAVQVQLSSNVYILNISQTGSSWAISQNTGVTNPNNSWNHIAVTRSGTSVKMFLNGTSIFSTTVSGALYSSGARSIINGRFGTAYFTGYVSNFRFVNGAALYTSNFTPPTEPLTTTSQGATAAQVELLTCQSNRFIDSSDNNFTITVSGTPQVLAVAPFNPTTAYSTATVGGSGYFDGTGDYLNVASNSAFTLDSSGNFTVECWCYLTSTPNNYTPLITTWTDANSAYANRWAISFYGSKLSWFNDAGGVGIADSVFIELNQWIHVAAVRSGSTITLYKNGVSLGTQTTAQAYTTQSGVTVGFVNNGGYITGWVSNARVVKGTAVYTSAFTPPTAPVTAIANTQLLLNYTNGGITDAAAKNVLETVGGAAISTAQSKFGGSAMYFDGSGDYLVAPAQAITSLTGDFTVEFWAYRPSAGNNFFYTTGDDALSSGIAIYIGNSGNNLRVYNANGVVIDAALSGISFPTSTWTHIALVRSSGVVKLFVAGSQAGSNWSSSTTFSGKVYLATEFNNGSAGGTGNCYLQDFRITNGYARYTANFTPPTAAFPTQ